MSRTATYSDEFLLRLIQRNMLEATDQTIELKPTDSLIDSFIRSCSDSFDGDLWFEFVCDIGRDLNLSLSPSGWCSEFFPKCGNQPRNDYEAACRRLSVGDLIAFIHQKSSAVSFAPLDWPCVPGCDTAGVFLGVKDLVAQISPSHARFAPSTPVAQVIRGTKLRELWMQLAVLSESKVPVPSSRLLNVSDWCDCLAVLSCVVGIFAGCIQASWGSLILGMFCGFGWFSIGDCLRESAVPLPPGVRTWGDLVRYLTPLWPGTHEIAQ